MGTRPLQPPLMSAGQRSAHRASFVSQFVGVGEANLMAMRLADAWSLVVVDVFLREVSQTDIFHTITFLCDSETLELPNRNLDFTISNFYVHKGPSVEYVETYQKINCYLPP